MIYATRMASWKAQDAALDDLRKSIDAVMGAVDQLVKIQSELRRARDSIATIQDMYRDLWADVEAQEEPKA